VKVGLDDYLCRHTDEELGRLLQQAEPVEKPPEGSRVPKMSFKIRMPEPWVPFPTDALPPPLGDFVHEAAAALGCDESFVALPTLSACASLIGNARTIELKPGWCEPSVLWTVCVGDSGTLKSPALFKSIAHLFALQRKLYQEYRTNLLTWRKAGKESGERPFQEKVICSDITIEKLASVLEDNPKGVLLVRDELSGWLGSFTRYKGRGGGSDLPQWLEIHRAGPITKDRETGDRPSRFVHRAAVSIAGGIQPEALRRALTPEFFESGLVARLLLAYPPRRVKRWSDAKVDFDTLDSYRNLVDDLRKLDFGNNTEGERVPRALGLSSEARKLWIDFYNRFAEEQSASEGEVAALLSKLEGAAARFALLHHVVGRAHLEADDVLPVEPCSIKCGITLARWFAYEGRRIYAMLAETSAERDARRLIEFIRSRGGSITVRELQRSNSRKYPTSEQADVALCALSPDHGSWSRPPIGPEGGQPAKVFTLRPTHDTTDTTAESAGGDLSDTTADSTPPTSEKPNNDKGSVGSVMRRAQHEERANVFVDPGDLPGSVGSSVGRGDTWEEL
jgi:hypothetical protein